MYFNHCIINKIVLFYFTIEIPYRTFYMLFNSSLDQETYIKLYLNSILIIL